MTYEGTPLESEVVNQQDENPQQEIEEQLTPSEDVGISDSAPLAQEKPVHTQSDQVEEKPEQSNVEEREAAAETSSKEIVVENVSASDMVESTESSIVTQDKPADQDVPQNKETEPKIAAPEAVKEETITEEAIEAEEDFGHPLESRKRSYAFNQLVANFSGCGRCSYFLAQSRIIHGETLLEKAVSSIKLNQMRLPWVFEMRDLLVKSYGIEFHQEHIRFNGSCPECRRPFTYLSENKAGEPEASFGIHLQTKVR